MTILERYRWCRKQRITRQRLRTWLPWVLFGDEVCGRDVSLIISSDPRLQRRHIFSSKHK